MTNGPASTGRIQKTVRLVRYAQAMSRGAARNVLFVILAISVGFALGAVTKFGFGYNLDADTSQTTALAAQ